MNETRKTVAVRELLRENLDGMTIQQIAPVLGQLESNLRHLLKEMPDTYIDRWIAAPRGQWAAVWCCVVPPEDCPEPDGKPR